jgi:IS5 family transposase
MHLHNNLARRCAENSNAVECTGKGKASAPYDGVKASVVTTNARAPGGQFNSRSTPRPGNP